MDNMKNKIGVIIQARMGSTRLPGKILFPFEGTTILGYIIDKFNRLDLELVVATSESSSETALINYLEENNQQYFRGSENNVLQRFIDAAEAFSFTHIIRVCADSPFIDMKLVAELLRKFDRNKNVDYLSYSYNEQPTVLSHFGVFVELVSLKALKKVKKDYSDNALYQEHVTIGVYTNQNNFKVKLYPVDERFKKYEGLRLTVDTQEDYAHILKIARDYFDKENNDTDFLKIAPKIIADSALIEGMKLISNKNKK